jgi:hypothetical protein
MHRHYLVFGASGYIGGNLVPSSPRGASACAPRRAAAKVMEARQWENVEIVEADALDPGSLPPALADIDVAFYLVHSMASGSGFGALDLEAAENFARGRGGRGHLAHRLPRRPGARRLEKSASTSVPAATRARCCARARAGHGAARRHHHRPGSAAFEVMRDLVLNLPVMVTPRWVRAKSPPIALGNLLEYLWGWRTHRRRRQHLRGRRAGRGRLRDHDARLARGPPASARR